MYAEVTTHEGLMTLLAKDGGFCIYKYRVQRRIACPEVEDLDMEDGVDRCVCVCVCAGPGQKGDNLL